MKQFLQVLFVAWFLPFHFMCPSSAIAGPLDLLPSWPISNVGDAIPNGLIRFWAGSQRLGSGPNIRLGELCKGIRGQFSSFPSKAVVIPSTKDPIDTLDPDDLCGDGDQTTYDGMLCAAGVKEGCDAVREAQDSSGRWFRSPHRRWMWTARCPDKTLDSKLYRDRCALGFSPDMNLGVLLYALQTGDRAGYQRWLAWLNMNAATTVLCKKRGDQIDFSDCVKVEWPRVCPEDLGYDKEPGAFQIDGRYGGKCALRPTDALDFAAVNDALGVDVPDRISNWEVNSRALLGLGKELASTVVPGLQGLNPSPIVILSSVDQTNFPLHLDGVRILIRMMIRNPGLKISNLPDLPGPDDISSGALDALSSDGTDPASIHIAAKIISDRYRANPFFRLLADGPSPDTRALILERCPVPPASDRTGGAYANEVGNHWLWEKYPSEVAGEFGAPRYSMGWDCVFVASLYNKMRVKKDLADELLDLFLKYADPLDATLKDANQAAQLAQGAVDLQLKAVDEAQRGLDSAHKFVDGEYSTLRKSAAEAAQRAIDELYQLDEQEQALESDIRNERNRALNLPDEIEEKITQTLCPDWVPPGVKLVCQVGESYQKVKNKAKKELLDHVSKLEGQLSDLRTISRNSARSALSDSNRTLTGLDIKLQSLTTEIAAGTLQAILEEAKFGLSIQEKTLSEARKVLAAARRAHSRVLGLLAVWRDDPVALESVTESKDNVFAPDLTSPKTDAEIVPSLGSTNPGAVSSTDADLAPSGSYFTVVGSFRTSSRAIQHMEDLRAKDSSLQLDVLLPNGRSKYWIVASSANTTFDFANLLAGVSRRRGLQVDAYVLRLPNATNFVPRSYSAN